MQNLIIIKAGSNPPNLTARQGDFEDWILSGLQVSQERTRIIQVEKGEELPDLDEVAGVAITGSLSMVTDHLDWSENAAQWLARSVWQNIPVLGICYGHQLLAYALGGEVGDNPCGFEIGSVEVHQEEQASTDPLFKGLPNPMTLLVCHTQSVLRLPMGAQRLAFSQRETNQAFAIRDCAWGIQFHPEFNAEVVRSYIQYSRDTLLREGQDPDELAARCVDTPFGDQILQRFGDIVKTRL